MFLGSSGGAFAISHETLCKQGISSKPFSPLLLSAFWNSLLLSTPLQLPCAKFPSFSTSYQNRPFFGFIIESQTRNKIAMIHSLIPSLSVVPISRKAPSKPSLHLLARNICFRHQSSHSFPLPPIPFPSSAASIPPQLLLNGEVDGECAESCDFPLMGIRKLVALCGFGYWLQGFRCFPWLALNFHMAHNLSLNPSTLQLVQNFGNLPMVAKPLYGLLSDAFFIGGGRRLPYISIGVLLQILSWGSLAWISVAGEALPSLMACVIVSNMGASITEVAEDALVAEYGQRHKINGLQSYAFMGLAAGGVLGNLFGGFFLLKTPSQPLFLTFTLLLSLQLAISLSTKEKSFGLTQLSNHRKSVMKGVNKQLSDLAAAISDETISRPLSWIVMSIATIPTLSGSIFCYQTQCLGLDPWIIGMSRVISQLALLSITLLYERCWKKVSVRRLVGTVQILYAFCLLLDLVLVEQINLKLGIPNEMFTLCFSGLAESLAQFKILPFWVMFARVCPRGSEGSVTAFVASALCLSSIVSGFMGVGLSSLIGVSAGDYSRLRVGIWVEFGAALQAVMWIKLLPWNQSFSHTKAKRERQDSNLRGQSPHDF